MKRKKCPKCKNLFRCCNFEKHIKVCSGTYKSFVKLTACKYCSLDFSNLNTNERANHSRWCVQNPKRSEYINIFSQIRQNKIDGENSIEIQQRISEGIKKAHARGAYKNAGAKRVQTKIKNGTLHPSQETIEKLREKALNSPHRRLVRSIREYVKLDGTIIMLDSSWEEALAKRLDDLNIKWERPEVPVKWIDSAGKSHHYFPDFYLVEYDLFLDPKNPQARKVQKEKIDIILKQMSNLRILKTLNECEEFEI